MVAQKRHQTCILGGSRQLLCGGRIWLGVLEGWVEGTVDAHPDSLSWARAPPSYSEYGLLTAQSNPLIQRIALNPKGATSPGWGLELRVTN